MRLGIENDSRFQLRFQRTRDNSNDFRNNRIASWFHNLSLEYVCVRVRLSLSLSLSLYLCAFMSLSLSVRVCVCASLFYLCPSLRLFRLVGEMFGCIQVCCVLVWNKTATIHLIFCRRMLLLFSRRKRSWKERCSGNCIYNGIAARAAAAAAAACLTGLTRLTDTSAAANIWRDCWRKKAFLSPSATAGSCNTNANAIQV